MFVRAWVPSWGAEFNSFEEPTGQAKPDYSMWFIGHEDEVMLDDEALNSRLNDAKALGIISGGLADTDDFHSYLESLGYTAFTTAHQGNVYVAFM